MENGKWNLTNGVHSKLLFRLPNGRVPFRAKCIPPIPLKNSTTLMVSTVALTIFHKQIT